MKNRKTNLAIKIISFLFLQIFVLATIFSAAVVIFNTNYGLFTQSQQEVKKTICHMVATDAAYQISMKNFQGNQGELLYGEQEAVGFGYRILPLDDNGKIKTSEPVRQRLHPEMKNQQNTYYETFYHDDYAVEIYLSDLDMEGALPSVLEEQFAAYNYMYQHRNYAVGIGVAGVIGGIFLLIFLMVAAGHGSSEHSTFVKRLPVDLMAFLGFCCFYASVAFLSQLDMNGIGDVLTIVCAALGVLGMSVAITGFLVVFAAVAKQGQFWKMTILYRCVYAPGRRLLSKIIKLICRAGKIFGKGIEQLPLIWKTVVGLFGFFLINFLTAMNMMYSPGASFLWFLETAALSVCVIYIALSLKRLQEGAKHLAEGDLSYQIDKNGLVFDLAEHAENLNRIGEGMAKAVNEKTKSERFKAELITNVSHDIKTPLTSIINYVDFLKKEELDNEKAAEYVEVLDRQANRLKKLTEDLVDASKAATGNIKMELAPCQVGVLMTQTMGEYKEKAEGSDLKFVMKLPDEELDILADGRRLWRVFDNLLNNICKYSQPGTRVYLDLNRKGNKAVITYRNTSKYELNITEEELMERFVRGDSSRHTEGSGLGLSIARNLVELQGGSFQIKIDGDLFKVVMAFPLIGF